jgi:predicted deacylase
MKKLLCLTLGLIVTVTVAVAQKITVIGKSVLGREIVMAKYGNGPQKVLIIGGVHGDELPSVPLVANLEQDVREFYYAYPNQTIYFIRQLNPDGVAADTRVNASGVDLNRNMEFDWSPLFSSPRTNPGPSPYSEPETRALRETIENIKPDRILSVHAYANILDFDTDRGRELAERMSKFNGMLVSIIGYPTPGSLGRYCTAMNIPLVTLELPGGVSDITMFNWQRKALWAFIRG